MSMREPWIADRLRVGPIAVVLAAAAASARAQDWPTYNGDVAGSRCNHRERAIQPDNAAQLEVKWRFPESGSNHEIGVIHATPIVVDGCIYFGTATDPTFYKLAPDGQLRWSYRNPLHATPPETTSAPRNAADERNLRFQNAPDGILGSALVTDDSVFFGDLGGRLYALDRKNGAEHWKLDTRAEPFPGAHPLNAFFASPIVADGKLIVAGGTLEQVVAAFPGYRGCTGRGFVAALDPKDGHLLWKYDVGPKPEKLEPPITITDSWGDHTFYFGPATSCVWCTPSYDAEHRQLFFGTDVNTAPRWPTADDPRSDTRESCAVIALDVTDGAENWVTQISPGDIWTNAMRAFDPKTSQYKDQSIGDTPKIYSLPIDGKPTEVLGVGCKNGGFYVLKADDGTIVAHTPIYTGPPVDPPTPKPDPRMLALPSPIGGLQTGCATDGTSIFTNGIDALCMGSTTASADAANPPTAGRVVAISLDTKSERWRHERPKIAQLGSPPASVFKNVGDPVASGLAVANGVLFFTTAASGKLLALDAATGTVLKEFELGPVWSGPSVSRGRVYVGSGNTLFNDAPFESYFPKKSTGVLWSFGLPGEDEVTKLGAGKD